MSEAQLQHNHDIRPRIGAPVRLSPLLRRIVADNGGPFTFTGTGTYLVGRGKVAVIDPGPRNERHITAILSALAGEAVSHILITHTHKDHSPAAAPLREATGAPVLAFGPHATTAGEDSDKDVVEEGADLDFAPDTCLNDGDCVEGPGWRLEAVHTPGHTSNHLCFALPQESALLTGDHVMGWSTTVIAPPDGDMNAYLESLSKLRERADAVLWPTHGPPVLQPHAYLDSLIAHRLRREAAILACLEEGVETIPAIVGRLYANLPKALQAAAARSVQAHLIRLITQGRVACAGEPRLDSAYRYL